MRIKSFFLLVCAIGLALPLALVSAQGGTIGANDVVEGTLNASQADYSLSLDSGQGVSITLISDDFDAYLQVLDGDGTILASDDDSAGSLNSALLFTAPLSATYTVRVSSFGGSATGAYTLTTAEAALVMLAYDTSAKVLFDGTGGSLYYTFTGKEGDVVNLYTDNPDLDLRMWLYAPDGFEVGYDDDGGDGYAPMLRRVVLPASGAYQVTLTPYSQEAAGVANLVLELTELMMLDDGPQTIEMNDGLSTETFGLTVEEGMTYRVTVASDVPSNGNLEIMLDPTFYDVVSLNFNNTLEASAVFTSTVSGAVTLSLNNYTWASDSVVYTASIEPVE